MDIISGITAASAALNGANSLIKSLRGASRPWPGNKNSDFEELLVKQLQQSGSTKSSEVTEKAKEFLSERDKDKNGALSLRESGMSREVFKKLDTDGDGQVSQAELIQPFKTDTGASA